MSEIENLINLCINGRGEVYKKCIDKLKFEGYNIRTSEQDSLNIIAEKL